MSVLGDETGARRKAAASLWAFSGAHRSRTSLARDVRGELAITAAECLLDGEAESAWEYARAVRLVEERLDRLNEARTATMRARAAAPAPTPGP